MINNFLGDKLYLAQVLEIWGHDRHSLVLRLRFVLRNVIQLRNDRVFNN